jgi:hypothetical protein
VAKAVTSRTGSHGAGRVWSFATLLRTTAARHVNPPEAPTEVPMIHRLRPGRVSGIPCRFRILIALGSCLAIPIGVSAQSASAGPIELWGTYMGETKKIDNGQNIWQGFNGLGNLPRLDATFGGSEGDFKLSLDFIPGLNGGINGNHKLPLEFFLKEADNHQNGVFGRFLWETKFTLDIVDGQVGKPDEVKVADLLITHLVAPHPNDGELPNNALMDRPETLWVSGADNEDVEKVVDWVHSWPGVDHLNGNHKDGFLADLWASKEPTNNPRVFTNQITDWDFSLVAFHTPEIDPAGLGSVMGLVLGACGLMERRLRVTRAPGAAARG